MYPVERYMKILKGYVKSQCHPKASIIESYISEESIEFCFEYLSKTKSIGVPEKCWHFGRYISKSSKGVHFITKLEKRFCKYTCICLLYTSPSPRD